MAATSARRDDYKDGTEFDQAAVKRSRFPNLYAQLDDPERKWEVEVVPALVALAGMLPGWDSYDAPPIRRDAGHFALEILNGVMRPRTPPPQIVPSSVGGVQLEWHEKGIDLELHITAPYEWELWFQDHQDPNSQPLSRVLSDDFSDLKQPIALLTTR